MTTPTVAGRKKPGRSATPNNLGVYNPGSSAAPLGEVGTTGLNHTGAQINEEYLAVLRGASGRRVLREMADDPVISAGLLAWETAVTGLDWHIEPRDTPDAGKTAEAAKAAEFVQSALDDMNQSLHATLIDVCTMLRYGWVWLEQVYKRRVGPDETDPTRRSANTDGLIGWRKWAFRSQNTLWGWAWDDDGGVAAMLQQDMWSGQAGSQVVIPIEKSLLFRTTSQGGNPEGRPLIRGCFGPWHFKRRISEFEAIGIERDLAGLPVARLPAEYLSEDASSEQQAVAREMRNIVEQIKRGEQDGVLLPSERFDSGEYQYSLELLTSGGQRQFDLDATIARYDQRIAMAMLTDFIMLGHENVGSQSLGETKKNVWERAVDAIAKGIADVVNLHAIPRLLKLNGMDVTLAPQLVYGDVRNADLTSISTFVQQLITAGALTPDAPLEVYLREVGGLPAAEVDLDEVHRLPDPSDIAPPESPGSPQPAVPPQRAAAPAADPADAKEAAEQAAAETGQATRQAAGKG